MNAAELRSWGDQLSQQDKDDLSMLEQNIDGGVSQAKDNDGTLQVATPTNRGNERRMTNTDLDKLNHPKSKESSHQQNEVIQTAKLSNTTRVEISDKMVEARFSAADQAVLASHQDLPEAAAQKTDSSAI